MIYTIGHSASSAQQFLDTLSKWKIRQVIDIRTHPLSKWAHFNLEEMCDNEGWLARYGIAYQWRSSMAGWQQRHAKNETLATRMKGLGVDLSTYDVGYYPRSELAARVNTPDPNTGWVRRHERDFSWFTVLPEFQVSVSRVMNEILRGRMKQTVLMCSEYDWTKCHRAQVADYITYNHGGVSHLLGEECIPHDWHQLHRMNQYDHEVVAAWGKGNHAAT